MGIFDSFRKKKPEERVEKRRETPRQGEEVTSGKWQVGDRIENRYEIHHILGGPGKSGMGIVYICYDHEWKETVAIKTFQDKYLLDRASIERFKWEVETWTRLEKHYNIVQAWYVEKIEGRPYIFLEYIVGDEQYGTDLSGWIWGGGLHRDGKPDIPLILNFAIQFCHGMIHAEKKFKEMGKPFVHRDVKPSNILVTRDRVVKITDFGLVKAFAESGEDIPSITVEDGSHRRLSLSKSGNICGTPPYMSPEQCRGEKDIDVRSDIYSFGCVLYEMLTGRYVFDARTPKEFIKHHLTTKPDSPDANKEVDKVVLKCLEKEAVKRYKDFQELEGELSRIYYGLTGEVIKPPSAQDLEAWELSNKVVSLGNLGLLQKAIDCYQQALRLDPNDTTVYNNLGNAYKAQGKLDAAVAEYRKALRINPNDAYPHNNLGIAYYDRGELAEAIKEYKEALRINPNYFEARYNLGVAYEAQGKLAKAISEYKETIRINPNYAEAHNNLGNAYKTQGKLAKAISEYKEAIRINPNYANAHYNLGNTYKAQGELDEAIREYREALRINPNLADAHNNLRVAYAAQGKLDAAVAEFRETLRIDPDDADAHNNLGTVYKDQGELAEAIREYKEALRINPNFADVFYNLGVAYDDQSKCKEAIESYRAFVRLATPQDVSWVKQAEESIRQLKRKM